MFRIIQAARFFFFPALFTLLAAAMLLSAVPAQGGMIDCFANPPAVLMGPAIFTAKNWAGYVAESNFSSPVSYSVTAVGGTWIVPTATPSTLSTSSPQDCAVWVGIDGFSNSTVEQIGTESYISNGVPYYDAWYEMYPAGMLTIYSVPVHAGDSITASVKYGLASNPTQFQLSLTNNTTGKSYTRYSTGSTALRSSAEWIAEAPSSGSTILPLPTFGSVAFTDSWATIGGVTGAIDGPTDGSAAWQVTKINMSNVVIGDIMNTSDLTLSSVTPALSSFSVSQPVPEPAAILLLAVAAVTLIARRKIERGYRQAFQSSLRD